MTTSRLVVTAMLGALAFLAMATVQFPLLPQASFLKYDPSDAIALLAGVLYGPAAGAAVVLVKDALFLLLRGGTPFGVLADLVAATTFVGVTAWAYRRRRGSFARRLLTAAALGAVARVLVMIPTNFIILFLEFGMPPARVAGLMLPVIIPFNALKALINAGIALVLVEPLVRHAPQGPSPGVP
ncbi:MAG: ECF transporter S component [Armatimonadota bacterium]